MSDAPAPTRRFGTTTGSKRKAERLPSCNHCGATLDEREQEFGEGQPLTPSNLDLPEDIPQDDKKLRFQCCGRLSSEPGCEKGPHQKQKKKRSEDEEEHKKRLVLETEYHWERNASGKRVKVRREQKESMEAKALFEAEEKARREREYEEVFLKQPPTDYDAEGQWRRLASVKWEKVEDEEEQEPEWKRIVSLWKERKAAGGTTSGQIVATP
ncbi:hypothetical protein CGCA056_v009997 [Colletotrichum aenigma]|uniref:uncharacterized protein n=1 Tax=Colletotrichum aenigma TaxID=1215731 RepID=UPI001872428E|nr:uncharacterized protein CGCA056_v009997 [Colletotrichum aenigma]KAF5518835.1 hypothetical protein CGCA056_v009997 [Colletotrichum aenigma]